MRRIQAGSSCEALADRHPIQETACDRTASNRQPFGRPQSGQRTEIGHRMDDSPQDIEWLAMADDVLSALARGVVPRTLVNLAMTKGRTALAERTQAATESLVREWALLELNANQGSRDELGAKMRGTMGSLQFADHVRTLLARVAVARSRDKAAPLIGKLLARVLFEGRDSTTADENAAIGAIEALSDGDLDEMFSSLRSRTHCIVHTGSSEELDRVESDGWWGPAQRAGAVYFSRQNWLPGSGLASAGQSFSVGGHVQLAMIVKPTKSGSLVMQALSSLMT